MNTTTRPAGLDDVVARFAADLAPPGVAAAVAGTVVVALGRRAVRR